MVIPYVMDPIWPRLSPGQMQRKEKIRRTYFFQCFHVCYTDYEKNYISFEGITNTEFVEGLLHREVALTCFQNNNKALDFGKGDGPSSYLEVTNLLPFQRNQSSVNYIIRIDNITLETAVPTHKYIRSLLWPSPFLLLHVTLHGSLT